MKRILLFASGSGSNAENIIHYFRNKNIAMEFCILTNNSEAGVIERAERLGIECKVFGRGEFKEDSFLETMGKADLIVLAGFLWLIPAYMVKAFPNKIINIHPALLPAYGGKGMYGAHVHKAVVENKEAYSGISIHYVNEVYDDGEILLQAKCALEEGESPESLAAKIHALEYAYFPVLIEQLLR